MTRSMLPRLLMLLFIVFAGIYACSQNPHLDLEAARSLAVLASA